jgi:hypothetical protein
MDKKNFLIGISLLILAFYLFNQQSVERRPSSQRSGTEVNSTQPKGPDQGRPTTVATDNDLANNTKLEEANSSQIDSSIQAPPKVAENPPFKALSLGADDPIEIFFSNQGGAIREIRLKKSDRVLKEYQFQYTAEPALGISFENQAKGKRNCGDTMSARTRQHMTGNPRVSFGLTTQGT